MNGVLVGDYGPRPASSAMINAGGNATSPVNSFIVKIILILLSSLLVANVLLFFRLYNLVKLIFIYFGYAILIYHDPPPEFFYLRKFSQNLA